MAYAAGAHAREAELQAASVRLRDLLTERAQRNAQAVELAFYGGTFTALPDDWPERFLAVVQPFMEAGSVLGVRCSTRPDAVSVPQLLRLKALGLRTVELGVQTFDNDVLARSLRGYDGETASAACRMVHEAGLGLGIQLLPGLPGHTPAMLAGDMRAACALRPKTMRLYPCVVVRGTGLARLYERGEYAPWTLDTAAEACASALRVAWRHGVRVIRIGVAQEPSFTENVLAGPYHPAFGSMVRGRALVPYILRRVEALGRAPRLLMAPQGVRGEFWGYRSECRPLYAAAGLEPSKVCWWGAQVFCLL
ncbi:radical SAM protein [Desulfovibrio psychrotolerans]|uniref:Radical SAM protein n=2 Tax=Desulfovibrio psychrotolerans TaxID=415242 RepID=A0A7J0BW38_9BACT|nr:radical SAM protein [Desulfovibrio psychrotolerans]